MHVTHLLALALTVLLLPALPVSAGSSEEGVGPGILLLVQNRGESAASLTFTVADATTGQDVASRSLDVPPGARATAQVPLPEGRYTVRMGTTGTPTDAMVAVAYASAETRDCPGDYLTSFYYARTATGFAYGVDGTGCTVAPRGYAAFEEEVRRGLATAPGEAAVTAGVPHDGDRGAYRRDARIGPPDWEAAETLEFAWNGTGDVVDEWGRGVPGHELRLLVPRPLVGWGVDDRDPLVARYRAGGARAFAHTQTGSESMRASGLAHEFDERRRLLYQAPSEGTFCLLRNPLQGARLQEGGTLPGDSLCVPGVPRETGEWRIGVPAEHRGFPAVPLYLAATAPDGARVVARAWMAEGVAYPIEVEVYSLQTPCCAAHRAYLLARLASDGAPLAGAASATPAPTPMPAVGPVHPLEGPSPAPAGDRFPFPLDDASRAARADPALSDLRALLAKGDAALAGAVLRYREAPGPLGMTTPVWTLAFTAPDARAVFVRCERARPAPGLAPVTSCEEVASPPMWAAALKGAPSLGARDLPAEGVGFAAALARWDALVGNPGEAPTHAVYRAWSVEDGERGEDAPCATACIAVGREVPLRAFPATTAETVQARAAFLDLATGRSVAETYRLVRANALGDLPLFIDAAPGPAAPNDPGGPLLSGPGAMAGAVVGVVALLALLAALFKGSLTALYTRLTKSTVLEQESRARVYETVRAEPGIHASAVAERSGMARGATEYHLDVLVREGFLACQESPGFKRYFVMGTFSPREMRALAALRNEHAQAIYRIVRNNPGIPLGAVAEQAGLSMPHASKTVKRLVEAGLVERVQEGRSVILHVPEKPA